jgi:hypothetical protein
MVFMRITSSVTLLLAGMLAGMVLVLSCGDDSPGKADAAACDCPAAESPIAGRIKRFSNTQTVAAGSASFQSAGCPQGGLVLSGSCTNNAPSGPDLTLQQAGSYDDTSQGWNCFFKNNSAVPVTIKATAICLMPEAAAQ